MFSRVGGLQALFNKLEGVKGGGKTRGGPIDWLQVLCVTRDKIGEFGGRERKKLKEQLRVIPGWGQGHH